MLLGNHSDGSTLTHRRGLLETLPHFYNMLEGQRSDSKQHMEASVEYMNARVTMRPSLNL
jgi:hypothetical protein